MNANTVPLLIVSWNVRGLGDSDKCKTIRDTLVSARLDVACIQETKLSRTDPTKARSFLPPPNTPISLVLTQMEPVVAC